MTLKKFLMVAVVAAVLVACGDDDSSFATRPSDGSSSSVTPQNVPLSEVEGSSDSETSVFSSSTKPSSSSVESSSSDGYVEPSTVVKGTMTDERDGQTYKTVTIGTQTWMAENLNYDTDATNCYDGREDLCTIYGGLYKWGAAMVVCPSGWHLPDTTEWKILITAVGGESTAGRMLKSTSGWDDYKGENVNGTDAYSFAVLPAGYYFGNVMDYRYEGSYTCFWSSTGNRNTGSAYYMRVFVRDDASLYYENNYKFSVRCVQDSE